MCMGVYGCVFVYVRGVVVGAERATVGPGMVRGVKTLIGHVGRHIVGIHVRQRSRAHNGGRHASNLLGVLHGE